MTRLNSRSGVGGPDRSRAAARAGHARARQADGFGNYDDRLQRDDGRYILTYVSPSVGFESQAGFDMIQEILNRYPHRRTVATVTVNETGGPDRAALIEKVPGR
jgi:hypothetical protein